MKIHHIRNATFVIESGDKYILVDPMLGKKGSSAPFTLFRFKPLRNPTVELPDNANEILDKITHCLITHLHPDHLDEAAVDFLKSKNIPLVCSHLDKKKLIKKGLNVALTLKYEEPQNYLGGSIIGIKAIHGYGFVKKIAGNVMGYYLTLPNEKSIYVSSDTVYTEFVDRTLRNFKPEITVFAAGIAQLDFGKPLLMTQEDMLKFIKNSPGKVMANHMEALNHCPHSRKELKNLLDVNNLTGKVDIPEDGETVKY